MATAECLWSGVRGMLGVQGDPGVVAPDSGELSMELLELLEWDPGRLE